MIIVLALAASAAWAFAAVAETMSEGESHSIDRRIVFALRDASDPSDPIGPAWFEEIARDVTGLGGITVLGMASLAVIIYVLLRRAYKSAVVIAIAVVGAQLASSLLKLGFDRQRPELVPHLTEVYTASFPSGHAMVSTAVYLTFATQLASLHRDIVIRGYLIATALALVTVIGASRVYLGVHWPTDVLAGWAAGGAWALVVWAGTRWYSRRQRPS
jgi:undecaprenyl-diphosphatase